MPKIVIDNREIEVAAGTKVIEAAARLGIMIPRFCYHPGLGPVGACRVCAVKFLAGPFKGVQMSCMIEAKDGMIVSTTDEEAVDFRRYVIEWLMLHHPHDCPVCDEGGHCLLQDMTVSGGHGIRRYLGEKRTYRDQYLGPLLLHEMNRCIHCYRCSRFYQQFSGYRDLGAVQIGNRTYFGRYTDGFLESPFSGNLSDICPTGVYTDKPSRFFGRRWDYERSPSLCINCSLGCHTVVSIRYREVKRQEARFSEAVNGYFICDRGRYGFFYATHEERPRRARIDGAEVAFDRAVQTVGEKLAEIAKNAGPEAIASVGSWRSNLETLTVLRQVCRMNGWQQPSCFVDQFQARSIRSAVNRLEADLRVSLRQLEAADFILVVGADPLNEAPMSALAMRQARRNGARVVVVDPRPIFLPFDFQHLPVRLDNLNFYLSMLVKAAVDCGDAEALGRSALQFYEAMPDTATGAPELREQLLIAAEWLRASRRPIIVSGTDALNQATPSLAADLALLLQAAQKKAGLFYLMPGANAFGAALLADKNGSLEKTVENIENGSVKALVLVEGNPFWQFADRQRLEEALKRLDLLVVLDYVNSAAVQKAHIFLPTATLYETGGVFINQEGRVQAALPAYAGGTPVAQVGGGDHPPRVFGGGLSGTEPRAAWQALAALADFRPPLTAGILRTELWHWLSETIAGFTELPPIEQLPEDGLCIKLKADRSRNFAVGWHAEVGDHGDGFEMILTEKIFGTEELSANSACLRELESPPCVMMHAGDAESLGLRDGDHLVIHSERGSLEAVLRAVENMACGTLIVPKHRRLSWQNLGTRRTVIRRDQISKIE